MKGACLSLRDELRGLPRLSAAVPEHASRLGHCLRVGASKEVANRIQKADTSPWSERACQMCSSGSAVLRVHVIVEEFWRTV